MGLALAEPAGYSHTLAVVLFGIGIIALMFTFRRTIILRRRDAGKGKETAKGFSATARSRIEQIDRRTHYDKRSKAMILNVDGSEPTKEQLAKLKEISRKQQRWKDR